MSEVSKRYLDYLDSIATVIAKWGVGLIVGSGFSKAVVGSEKDTQACNWKELFLALNKYLTKISKNPSQSFIKIDECLSQGQTLPQIATSMCKKYAKEQQIAYRESVIQIKKIVRSLVNWIPSDEKSKKYKKLLNGIDVHWVVTTNYDEVLESIFGEDGYPINPEESLTAPTGMIPIYHVHGSRKDYQSIILTQEDYVPLFSPGNYRAAKLETMMTERPILILGYSMSDLNLLSALDQSQQVLTDSRNFTITFGKYVGETTHKLEPIGLKRTSQFYREIEIGSISDFLHQLSAAVKAKQQVSKNKNESKLEFYKPYDAMINKLIDLSSKKNMAYTDFVETNLNDVIEAGYTVEKISKLITDFKNFYIQQGVSEERPIEFRSFNKSINIFLQFYKGRSKLPGKFREYDNLLKFIFFIIDTFPLKWFSPELIELIAIDLNYALESAEMSLGKSFSAKRTWDHYAKDFAKNDHSEFYDDIYLQADIDSDNGNLKWVKKRFDESLNEGKTDL